MAAFCRNYTLERRVFWVLTVATAGLASIAAIPFTILLIRTFDVPLPAPPAVLIASSTIASTLVLAIGAKLGLRLGRRMYFEAPLIASWLAGHNSNTRRLMLRLLFAASLGILLGAGIQGVSTLFVEHSAEPAKIELAILNAPIWQRVLIAVSAGVREEIFFRLALMTVCAWCWAKLLRITITSRVSIWLGNVFAALAFGLAHVPNVSMYGGFSGSLAVQAVVYNAAIGLTCGWVYWGLGIEAAMVVHIFVVLTTMILIPWAMA